jgi:hypothetical protein
MTNANQPMFHGANGGLYPRPNISALVLRRILVCRDRDFRPAMTSQKQKQLTPLNQQIEAL